MNRIACAVTLALVALAGCGEEKPAPSGAHAASKEAAGAKPEADSAKRAPDDAKAAAAEQRVAKFAATKKAMAAQLGDVPFTADWQAAMEQAKTSKKPLMFLFTEKDNAEGAKMGAGVFKDAKVVVAAAAFVPAVVDIDADAPLAEQYGARTAPMVVYASPSGEVLGSTIAASDLMSDMTAALAAMKAGAGDK